MDRNDSHSVCETVIMNLLINENQDLKTIKTQNNAYNTSKRRRGYRKSS